MIWLCTILNPRGPKFETHDISTTRWDIRYPEYTSCTYFCYSLGTWLNLQRTTDGRGRAGRWAEGETWQLGFERLQNGQVCLELSHIALAPAWPSGAPSIPPLLFGPSFPMAVTNAHRQASSPSRVVRRLHTPFTGGPKRMSDISEESYITFFDTCATAHLYLAKPAAPAASGLPFSFGRGHLPPWYLAA